LPDGIGGGFNTDCTGLTPVDGEPCEDTGTVCGLEEGADDVCYCTDSGDGTEWVCPSGLIGGIGGFGGSNGM
jgi:hypothetical protein